MARLLWILAPLLGCLALPVWADARMNVLMDVIKIEEAAEILRVEGENHAEKLHQEMLNGEGGPAWQLQVAAIYDTQRMIETVRGRIEAATTPEEREEIIAFYATDAGAQIVDLENAARAAFGDPDVEAAARARYAALEGSDDPRLGLITQMIDQSDMIDHNVTAAMNANFQFMRGLADGRAVKMSEAEMLAEVAEQQQEITDDTTAWLHGYMLLAYSPLSDEAMADYVAFSASPAGQALNRGLFDGFGKAYGDISYALGRALSLNMTAQDL